MRSTKRVNNKLGKRADYIQFDWVEFMSKEYFGVIDAINECYRKMLEIGKCKAVFQRADGNQCEILRAKSKKEFLNAKKNILLHYSHYVNSGAPKSTISIDVELAMDPRRYTNSGQEMPTEREIIVKKQLLEHKFVTNNLNIQKCNTCLECHMEKDVMMKQDSFTCKKCKDGNDPNCFIKNNMHPL
jgi:formylmethanofuran dehydrogenase subunit E